jgi:single-strand DNA-binding protein
MASYNRIVVMGNLGQDPEVKYTQGGQAVCQLSIAVNEQWTDKDGNRQEKVQWFRVAVWGKQAETCGQYLAKGRTALVEGRMGSRKYQDKDGNEREAWEITADRVVFVGGQGEDRGGEGGGSNRGGGGGWGGGGGGRGGQSGGGQGGSRGGSGGGGSRGGGGGGGGNRGGGGGNFDPFEDDPVPF